MARSVCWNFFPISKYNPYWTKDCKLYTNLHTFFYKGHREMRHYPAFDQNSGPEISGHLAGRRNKHIYSSLNGCWLPALKVGRMQGTCPQKYWREILVLAHKVALKFLMSDCHILKLHCINLNNNSNKYNFNTINVLICSFLFYLIADHVQLHFGVAPSSFQMD